MKSLLRSITFNSISLYFISLGIGGLTIIGGFTTFLWAGMILTLLNAILKPLLHIVSFPFTLITFGFFTFVINAIILYVLTVFLPTVHIHEFVFPGISFLGFIIPKLYINTFVSFLVVSGALSGILSFLKWLTT